MKKRIIYLVAVTVATSAAIGAEPTSAPMAPSASLGGGGMSSQTTTPSTERQNGERSRRNGRSRGNRGESRSSSASTRGLAEEMESVVIAPTERMPRDYDLLLDHSIFTKSRITRERGGGAPSMQVTAQGAIVFNGVVELDGVPVAFIEDTGSGRVTQLKVGDTFAKGKVKSITIDGMDYDTGDKAIHITIGQTIEGGEAPPVSERALPASDTPAPSGPTSDVLERLKAARLKALGGGQ